MSLSPRIRLRVLPSALPAPSGLSIGTVTSGTADAEITGDPPNQVLNLVLPPGPPNSLSIGTVTEGAAAASITGNAPTQVLNLTLPPGDAATIAIGNVDTVDNSEPATVTNVGTPEAAIFDFEIPAGPPGSVADGDKNEIIVTGGGTVWKQNRKGLQNPITPYDFAADPTAIGTGSDPDADTAALQAFLDYIALNPVSKADWSGSWEITEPLNIGVPDQVEVVTISAASPGVVTLVGHGKVDTEPVRFNTTGTLPSPLVAGTVYYVKSPAADTFNVAATPGGAAINTTGGSGTHYAVFPGSDSFTKEIVGELRVTPVFAMDQAITIWNCDHCHIGDIRIDGSVLSGGVGTYSLKGLGHGVVNRSSSRIHMGVIYADYCRGFAYTQTQRLGENDNTNTIDFVKAIHCGSGIQSAGHANNLTATFTGYTHPVTADNVTQRSQISGVSDFPPEYITHPVLGSSPPGGGHLFVVIGGIPYIVMAIDEGAGTIDVHPRIVPFATAGGTLDWMFGGGVNARGGDANNLMVHRIDAVSSAIALADNALYGANVWEIQSQGVGVIWSTGLPLQSSTMGGNVHSIYSESNNWFEVFQVSAQSAGNNFHTLFNHKTPLTLTKWKNLARSLKNADELPVLSLDRMPGIMFQRQGLWHYLENNANNADETFSGVTIDFSDWRTSHYKFPASARNVTITAAAAGLNAITGRQGKMVVIGGPGNGGSPTGTITFLPPGGATVNGGASAAFVHFIGAALFEVYHEVATNNYAVMQIGGIATEAFTALVDAATVAVDLRNARLFTLTIAGNRTMGAPSNLATAIGMPVEFVITNAAAHTLAWNAAYIWPAATAPTLTATAGRQDVFRGRVNAAGTAIRMEIGGQNYS